MATDICTKRLTKELRTLMKNPITDPKITVAAPESNICEVHYVIEVPVAAAEDDVDDAVSTTTTTAINSPSGTTGGNTNNNNTLPYAGGIYHGVLLFPKNYPLRPPGVKMLTQNGRFLTNRRLCLSMSDFHPESWNPMWSVGTIITGLYSFMIETNCTTGSMISSNKQKRMYAQHSLDYNVRDPTFCELFPQYVELYKDREAKKKAAAAIVGGTTQSSSSTSSSNNDDASNSSSNAIAIGGGRRRNYDGDDIDGFFATIAGFVAVFSIILAMRFIS